MTSGWGIDWRRTRKIALIVKVEQIGKAAGIECGFERCAGWF